MNSRSLAHEFEIHLAPALDALYSQHIPFYEAVSYVMNAKGKRVRAHLSFLACEIFYGDHKPAVPAALAVEFVHAYSLVHDDLPCLDNDDLRRGQPSAHRKFGEAYALLVGDTLQADAFRILTDSQLGEHCGWTALDSERRAALACELSRSIGAHGMVLGQWLDVSFAAQNDLNEEQLQRIHINKTGRLLGASLAMGAIAAGAPASDVTALRQSGEEIGLAFQIIDDLLDDLPQTGKTPGKDKSLNKLTYLSYLSREKAQETASTLTFQAIKRIRAFSNTDSLVEFVESLLIRNR